MTCRPPRRSLGTAALWVACLLPSVWFSLLPLGALAAEAVRAPRAGLTSEFFRSDTLALLGRSLLLSLLVALTSTILGTAIGYRLGATAWPGKAFARALITLPLLIPPYLHAVGWTTLLRPGGFVSSFVEWFGIEASRLAELTYSFGAAVLVLSLAYIPVAALFAEKALAWSSPSLIEAAQVFGAGRWREFFVARWPFLRPAALSAAAIIFILASSDLGVPTILKVRVFNFEVFTQLAAFNDARAATLLCVPLVVAGVLAVTLERRAAGRPQQAYDTEIEPPRPARPVELLANVATVGFTFVVSTLVPIGALVGESLSADAFAKMGEIARVPALNTLVYAGSSAAALLALAIGLTLSLRGAPPVLVRLTDLALAISFAVPSTIVALGLLATYDRPGWSRWLTPTILVISAIVVRYSILAYRVVQQAVNDIPGDLLDAAAIAGAGPASVWRYVVLPMIRTPLLAVFVLSAVLGSGEIGSTILLHPPGGETLPIALYAIEANSPRSYTAALALITLGFMVSILLVGTLLGALSLRNATRQRSHRNSSVTSTNSGSRMAML